MVTVWSGWPGVTLSLLQENYPVGVQEITLVLDNRSEMEFDYGEHFSSPAKARPSRRPSGTSRRSAKASKFYA